MKNMPLWIKCFLLCVCGVFFSSLVLSVVTFYRIYEDKEYIIKANAKNVSTYVDINVVEKLTMIEERFCGINMAENMWRYTKPDDTRSQLNSLWVDTAGTIGLYYVDRTGNGYVVGDVSGDLQSRVELVEQAKKTDAYKDRGRVWFYLKTDRGINSCVLFSDVVYIDDLFDRHVVGHMLLYVDADDMNKQYVDKTKEVEEEGIIIIDATGNIVFSTRDSWRGENFFKSFEISDTRFIDNNGVKYMSSTYQSDISGWKNIVYFSNNVIRNQTNSLFALILGVALLCLVIMLVVAYYVSGKIGKPIDELFKHIRISSAGNLVLPDSIGKSDTEEIKSIFDTTFDKLEKQMKDTYLTEIELKNLKIKAYESQLNPHFVFNTLQIIQMLSILGEREKVNEVIASLGEMMRFNLDSSTTVSLFKEIEVVENYFKILKHRFGDGFDYKIYIDEGLSECEVLKFTIQPFVENAIKHGFSGKKAPWEIVVMAKRVKDEVAFIIRDNGVGFPETKFEEIKKQLSGEIKLQNTNGIGICNVNNRIKLLYGEQYGVDIYNGDSTQVAIHMPYIELEKEENDWDV